MSGIVGWLVLTDDLHLDAAAMEAMLVALQHRGPHGRTAWHGGSVSLGHCLLWTTPESLCERLPYIDEQNDLVITADARLDNRQELINLLALRPKADIPDSQLILASYTRWRDGCLERLVGDFAFAIWDGRSRSLFCARDHFGVKPFYFYHGDGLFAFASEIKALLRLPQIPRRLNETHVGDYLAPMQEDKEITFYRDIWRLPPAHAMHVGFQGSRQRCYWALDPNQPIRQGKDEDFAAEFRLLFTEAVRCRLRSAFPVGSLLSGGMDSSSIACIARQILKADGCLPLHTFSAVFEGVPRCDERPFINAVLEQGDYEAHFLAADQISPLTDWQTMFQRQDEAFYSPNLFMHWGLHKLAVENGVRVILDGIDGDTTVSHGIAYLTELARRGRWLLLSREFGALSRKAKIPPERLLKRRLLSPFIPFPVRAFSRLLRGKRLSGANLDGILREDFVRQISLEERCLQYEGARLRPYQDERSEHFLRLTTGMIPHVLEVIDRSAATFSLEPRFPFFDKRLVEFCFSLPPEQKLRQGWTRWVMRNALRDALPPGLQQRGDKSDLSDNFYRGLAEMDRPLVEATLRDQVDLISKYVILPRLEQAARVFWARRTGEEAMTLWKAATLALWLSETGVYA